MSAQANTSFYAKDARQLAKVGCWDGALSLSLEPNSKGKTVLRHKQQNGPYTLQRPLYPEGDICHLILLHPPGGLVEADTLKLNVNAAESTHTVITTPSAGKVYCCASEFAGQSQLFNINSGACLEWFPQETILYEASKSNLHTRIELEGNAKFIGWEVLCLGRPISEDFFETGHVKQHIEILRDGKIQFQERFDYQADTALGQTMFRSKWGLGNRRSFGTFMVAGAGKQDLESIHGLIEESFEGQSNLDIGATLIGDLLVCRALAPQSRYIKEAFTSIWAQIRFGVVGTKMYFPRIWNT